MSASIKAYKNQDFYQVEPFLKSRDELITRYFDTPSFTQAAAKHVVTTAA